MITISMKSFSTCTCRIVTLNLQSSAPRPALVTWIRVNNRRATAIQANTVIDIAVAANSPCRFARSPPVCRTWPVGGSAMYSTPVALSTLCLEMSGLEDTISDSSIFREGEDGKILGRLYKRMMPAGTRHRWTRDRDVHIPWNFDSSILGLLWTGHKYSWETQDDPRRDCPKGVSLAPKGRSSSFLLQSISAYRRNESARASLRLERSALTPTPDGDI